MSNRELTNEAIRLIRSINADRMEDLVRYLHAIKEQDDMVAPTNISTPELLERLNESLRQAKAGQLISNEEVQKEIKRVLRDKMDADRKRGLC